jgi:hypothetical protein
MTRAKTKLLTLSAAEKNGSEISNVDTQISGKNDHMEISFMSGGSLGTVEQMVSLETQEIRVNTPILDFISELEVGVSGTMENVPERSDTASGRSQISDIVEVQISNIGPIVTAILDSENINSDDADDNNNSNINDIDTNSIPFESPSIGLPSNAIDVIEGYNGQNSIVESYIGDNSSNNNNMEIINTSLELVQTGDFTGIEAVSEIIDNERSVMVIHEGSKKRNRSPEKSDESPIILTRVSAVSKARKILSPSSSDSENQEDSDGSIPFSEPNTPIVRRKIHNKFAKKNFSVNDILTRAYGPNHQRLAASNNNNNISSKMFGINNNSIVNNGNNSGDSNMSGNKNKNKNKNNSSCSSSSRDRSYSVSNNNNLDDRSYSDDNYSNVETECEIPNSAGCGSDISCSREEVPTIGDGSSYSNVSNVLHSNISHTPSHGRVDIPSMPACDNITYDTIYSNIPIRGIRRNKRSALFKIILKLMAKVSAVDTAGNGTASTDEVLAFLYCPALSSLESTVLSRLMNCSDNDLVRTIVSICDVKSRNNSLAESVEDPSLANNSSGVPAAGAVKLPPHTIRRAKRLIEADRVGAASNFLDNSSSKARIADVTNPRVLSKLKELHPERVPEYDGLTLGQGHGRTLAVSIPQMMVEETVKELPRESGVGVYPWSFELIQLCFAESDEFQRMITALVGLMANGQLPHPSLWLQSRLIAIETGEKIRPIAVSDPWVRLTSRILSKRMMAAAQEYVGACQLGVGTKGGAEILVHSASMVNEAMLKASSMPSSNRPRLGILSCDARNAFNSLKRRAIGKAILDNVKLRPLFRYFRWAYGQEVPLMTDIHTQILMSGTGVRQGDPLGPMLFAIGIASTLKRVASKFSDIQILAYLDDVFLLGEPEKCLACFESLSKEFSALNLVFNKSKCNLLIFGAPPAPRVCRGISVVNTGLKVLGVPIGTPEYCKQVLKDLYLSYSSTVKFLDNFNSAESFVLLKSSINARPVHTLRGLHPELTAEEAAKFDRAIELALGRTVFPGPQVRLSPVSLQVKNLSAEFGGLGMRGMRVINEAAYVSSLITALRYIKENLPIIYSFRFSIRLDAQLMRQCHLTAGAGSSIDELLSPFAEKPREELPSQRSICREIDQRRFDALVTELKTSRNPAWVHWLMSSKTKGISSWLYIASKPVPGLDVSPEAFLDALRTRLLIPPSFVSPNTVRICGRCQMSVSDSLHALSCRAMSGLVTKRHDVIVGHIMKYCKEIVKTPVYANYPIDHQAVGSASTATNSSSSSCSISSSNGVSGNSNSSSSNSSRVSLDSSEAVRPAGQSSSSSGQPSRPDERLNASVSSSVSSSGNALHPRVTDYGGPRRAQNTAPPQAPARTAATTAGPNSVSNGSNNNGPQIPRDTRGDLKADLFLTLPGGNPCYLDLVVTNPSTPSTINANKNLTPGYGATEAEKGKFQKYTHRYGELIRSQLVPFGMEATGRLGPNACKFFDDIGRNISDDTDLKAKEKKAKNLLARRIAATLVIYNGILMSQFRGHSEVVPIDRHDYGDPYQDVPDDPASRDY